MLRTCLIPILAAAVIGSSSAVAMQFDLRPEQVKRMAVNATQAKAVAAFKTVAVLATVPNNLRVQARRDVCADIEAINDWDFRKQIEDHLTQALSARFTVVPVAYDADAVGKLTTMGQVPRNALPVDERVDAFIVIWGSVEFWHTPGLTGGMFQLDVHYPDAFIRTDHEPEYEFAKFTVDIINARTQRTIVRKEIQPYPDFGREAMADQHWHVRGKGAKERPEQSWLCGSPLTEEKKQELKADYETIIKAVFDFALPVLRLAPPQTQ
jgi:hypothetical protein